MSIVEDRTKIFSRFTTRFATRERYSGKLKQYGDYDGLLIKNNTSINEPLLLFSNFLSKEGTYKQKQFLQILKEKSNVDNILDAGFEIIPLKDLKKDETERLLQIINKYDNTNIQSITQLIKCKYWKEQSCQLYIQVNNKENIIEIVLIDLYHLALPAPRKVKGRIIGVNLSKQYKDVKNYDYDVYNILHK